MDTRNGVLSGGQVLHVGAGWVVERWQLGQFTEGGASGAGVLGLVVAEGGVILRIDVPIGRVKGCVGGCVCCMECGEGAYVLGGGRGGYGVKGLTLDGLEGHRDVVEGEAVCSKCHGEAGQWRAEAILGGAGCGEPTWGGRW